MRMCNRLLWIVVVAVSCGAAASAADRELVDARLRDEKTPGARWSRAW